MNRAKIALLVLILCLISSVANCTTDKLTMLKDIVELHFAYNAGDVPNAQSPTFDDSSWKVSVAKELDWGYDTTAWFRTTITVPDKIAGVSTAGRKITFKCGIDDDGVIYVNGKECQKFHWDQGNIVLTESAVCGEKFVIAIKGINTFITGRLLFAELTYSGFEDVVSTLKAIVDTHHTVTLLCDAIGKDESAQYVSRLSAAMDRLNMAALESDDNALFEASAKECLDEVSKINADLSKCFTISLIGHAHIDLAWLWMWSETVDVCKNTFSTVCNLMDQYPFVFAQSQAAAYDEMKRSYPEIYAKIKERVKRGQWDVSTAIMWSEGDTNMSSGEGILRSMLLANRFIKSEFGVDPTVGWLPDNFGHVWTLPQMFSKSGVNSLCFMRCGIGKPVFWMESPDGSRILAYNFADYNGGIDPTAVTAGVRDFAVQTGIRDFMKPFGVGDHGGGPTKEMLDVATSMQQRNDCPNVQYSTVPDYLNRLAKSASKAPVHAGELNPVFEGCYTSHADAKRANRDCENKLAASEAFSSIAMSYGVDYPKEDFEYSWKRTCFNEFHDILCGSGIHGIYDDTNRDHSEVVKRTSAAKEAALSAIASKVNTKGPGVPIIVFNPLAWTRTDPVTVNSPFAGQNTNVRITDASGKKYPARSLGDKLCFTARDVPAMGYKVFWANRVSEPVKSGVSFDGSVIANQYFRVKIDPTLGVITGIYDKLNGRSVMAPQQQSAVLQILTEAPAVMSSWIIGGIVGTKDLVGQSEVVRIDGGPAKVSVSFDHSYSNSLFTQEVTLYDDVPRIDIKLTADWHEPWAEGKLAPMLKAAFSANLNNPKATFDIPFGSIERPRNGSEVVAQKWIDISDPNYGVSLLNDCKYGFDVKDNTMRISLLRSSYSPDPNPDEGVHEVTYSLYPHAGDWRAAGTVKKGYELNEPLEARVVTAHPGKLPVSKSYVSVLQSNITVTALKKAVDDDNYIIRFYESHGKSGQVTVKTGLPVKFYAETDPLERQIGKKLPIKDGKFSVKTGKHEIKTYKLFAK